MGKKQNSEVKKGLPKRSGSKHPSRARRAKCWLNGQRRKAARIAAQHEREARNRQLRASGCATPWEDARLKRAEKRRNN